MRWVEQKKRGEESVEKGKRNEKEKKIIQENRIARNEKKRAVKVNHYASSIISLGTPTDCFAVRVEHFFFSVGSF